MHDDGLAYTKEETWPNIYNGEGKDPKYKMGTGLADVPDHLLDPVIESADECPGECIYLEPIE